MGNAINQDARVVWLAIRRQGGWWSVKQIVTFWHPTFALYEIEEIVRALVAGGFLMGREQGPDNYCYAFTSECKALPGTETSQEEAQRV